MSDSNKFSGTFVGTWSLAEWSVTHTPSGYVHYPFNGNAEGHIIYTDNGWVSATLMEKNRKPVPQDRHRLVAARMILNPPADAPKQDLEVDAGAQADLDELIERFCLASMGYISYCGPFELNDKQVQHHIKNSLVPQWVGTTLERNFDFTDDLLTLSTNAGEFSDKLVWKRVA